MRIAVDAHAIGRRLTGNEVYVRSLLASLAPQAQSHEIIAYISEHGAEQSIPANIQTRRVSQNPFVRLGWDLAKRCRRDRPDLLHVQYTAPVACRVPVVVTVHDVSFLEHPEYFTRDRVMQLQFTVRRTVMRAAKILTGTEFARSSILKVYGDLDEDRIVVVPLAAAADFRPISRETAALRVRERLNIVDPFVLCVGDLQPRKNHPGLIRAFARLVNAYPQLKHRLVLAGKETWFAEQVYRAARESGIADRIVFPGFVSDDDLLQLYNACDLFVFPSFYEGFGLPALEAMACARAVVCSHTSALPEVVNGAAVLFDPYKTEEMCRAMADVLLDAELRLRLERLGLQRSAHFNWQKTARKTLDVFESVVQRQQAGASQPVNIAQKLY